MIKSIFDLNLGEESVVKDNGCVVLYKNDILSYKGRIVKIRDEVIDPDYFFIKEDTLEYMPFFTHGFDTRIEISKNLFYYKFNNFYIFNNEKCPVHSLNLNIYNDTAFLMGYYGYEIIEESTIDNFYFFLLNLKVNKLVFLFSENRINSKFFLKNLEHFLERDNTKISIKIEEELHIIQNMDEWCALSVFENRRIFQAIIEFL